MGTFLFWATWVVVAIFYSVTTRQQREKWFWLLWLLTVACILTASILNALKQGYVTVL